MAGRPHDDTAGVELGDTLVDSDERTTEPSTDRPLGLGDKLGRFDIVKQLGAGGMGVVYVALDPTLNRQVAVKLLRSGTLGPLGAEAGRARLLREAQAMARLSHPNVIAVHEIGTAGDQVFVVMELNDGKNLSQWLKARPSWQEIIGVFIEAGAGLVAAHRAGMVHRDFKPDNVLIARDGRVRVTDFGLVHLASSSHRASDKGSSRLSQGGMLGVSLTQTGAVIGTPPYMAPEQHDAQPADERTDQYSFCVSLFEALYGKRPFLGDSYRKLVMNILEGNISSRPADTEVPEGVHALIMRGLSLDPADRFRSMDELLGLLRSAIEPVTEPATEQALPTAAVATDRPATRSQRRSRLWIGAAAMVVALAATASIVTLSLSDGNPTPAVAPAPDASDTTTAAAVPAPDAAPAAASPDAAPNLAKPDPPPPRRSSRRHVRTAPKSTPKPPASETPTPAKPADRKETAAERRARELNLDMDKDTP